MKEKSGSSRQDDVAAAIAAALEKMLAHRNEPHPLCGGWARLDYRSKGVDGSPEEVVVIYLAWQPGPQAQEVQDSWETRRVTGPQEWRDRDPARGKRGVWNPVHQATARARRLFVAEQCMAVLLRLVAQTGGEPAASTLRAQPLAADG